MHSNERGFTLIEVMVALTVLGLIATLLASGTRLSLDIAARGTARAESIRMEQAGHTLLRNQLEGALPFRYWVQADSTRVEQMAFDGEAGRIRFVSRDGIQDGPDNLPRWVEFRREGRDRESKLIVEERRILSPDNQPSGTVLARAEIMNCIDLRFDYLETAEDKPQWHATWNVTDRTTQLPPLPSAVRIECRTGGAPVKMLVPLDYAESARQGMVLQ